MYDVKSVHATEFIDNEEVLNTVKYAEDNKNNLELINKILEKAKLGNGLTHKEASVLLACEIEEKIVKEFIDGFRQRRVLDNVRYGIGR